MTDLTRQRREALEKHYMRLMQELDECKQQLAQCRHSLATQNELVGQLSEEVAAAQARIKELAP